MLKLAMLNFYEQLIPIKDFDSFTDEGFYRELPEDWFVFVTDIVKSTKAIEAGKYKEVNLASITVSIKAMKGRDFPYTFGGDGSSICVPPNYVDKVESELAKLKNLARLNYGLTLRVSKVPVKEIYKQDLTILVAKYELAKGRHIAFFRGGGISYAERIGKEYSELFMIDGDEILKEIEGVSCRWDPIPSKKGVILSLLIQVKDDQEPDVYSEVFKKINKITHGEENPVHIDEMTYKAFNQGYKDEMIMHKSLFSIAFLLRSLEYFICVLAFKYNISPLFKKNKYAKSMRDHSDFRKFDDTLRMVIDCSESEKKEILGFLDSNREKVYYGHHESNEALMTCYVDTIKEGGHLHFIDGANGGYALASVELKKKVLQG